MQTRSRKASDPSVVSMEVDATGGGAGGGATTTRTANDDDLIDASARAALSAPSESARLAACSELAAWCAPLNPLRVLDRVTANEGWWDRCNERSEDVRLERCRALSAALLLLADVERKAHQSPSPLPLSSSSSPGDDLCARLARCLALALSDDFHEVALAACEGARLLSELLAAEAKSFSARERALALDSVASSSSSDASSLSLPLPADLLTGALARAAASHRRHAVREAAATALGALCPAASRSGGALEGAALPALAALAAADPYPRVRAAATAAAGRALAAPRASAWLARAALPAVALALTDGDESVAATAAAAATLSLPPPAAAAKNAARSGNGDGEGGAGAAAAGGAAAGDEEKQPPPLRTTVSMEDGGKQQPPLRTTVSMEDAEAAAAAAAADLLSSFPFARPRALLFSSARGSSSSSASSSSSSSSPPPPSLEETLPWLAKLVLDDDDGGGLAENAVLSLALLPAPSAASGPFSSSSPLRRRGSPLFRLDSDAAAASSARLLWGLVSLCGGDIEGNARRERYGARLVRSLLALLRAAAAAAAPSPAAAFGEENGVGEGAASPPSSQPSLLLLRSVSLAAQAVGAWVPLAAWLGPATEIGGGGGGASGRGDGGTFEDDEGFDVGLRCGLLKLLLFGLEAASKLEDNGAAAPDQKAEEESGGGRQRWKKRRLLRAGGEVEAVAAVAVAAVAASAASSSSWSSPARSVLSLVSALISTSGEGELRRLDAGRRAELWLSAVASEEEAEEEAKEAGRREGGGRQGRPPLPPRDETVSSRLAAACGFATTAALAAEHAPAVLEIICRDASRWTPASPAARLLPALARACDSTTLSMAVPRIVEALCKASASERGRSDAVFAAVLLRAGAQVLTTTSCSAGQQQQDREQQWRRAAAAAFLSGAALPALSWLPPPQRSFSSPSAPFSRARPPSAASFEGGGFEGADAVRAAASAVVALLSPLLHPGDAAALFSSSSGGRGQGVMEQQQGQQKQWQLRSPSPFVAAVTSNLSHRGSGSSGGSGGSGSGGSGTGSSGSRCAAASCAALGAALAATAAAAGAAPASSSAPFDVAAAVISGTWEPGIGALVSCLGGASVPGVRAAAAEALGEALGAAAAVAAAAAGSPSSSSPLTVALEAAVRALERYGEGEAIGSIEVAEAARGALRRASLWREATSATGAAG